MENTTNYKSIKRKISLKSTKLSNKIQHELLEVLQSNPDKFNDVIPFITYMLERIETVTLLAKKSNLWDAEIIFRSLLEVFMKYLNIISQENSDKFKTKLNEFWIVLDEIEQVRDSDKAKEIVKSDRILNLQSFDAFILTAKEEEKLKAKPSWANKKYRTSLKNDWSFSGILINMIKAKPTGIMDETFISLELLQHYYKLSSHIAHGDNRGLSDIIARRKKTGDYAEALNLVHYFKFIKTVTIIPMWIVYTLALHLGDISKAKSIVDEYKEYDDYITGFYTPVMEETNRLIKEAIEKAKTI